MLPPHVLTPVIILVFWNLFAAFTCILFFLHRDVPLIFHRNVPLTLVVAITGTLLIDLHLFRLIFKSSFPCFLILWIPALLLPVYVFTMLTRFVFLAKEYWTNKYKLALHDAVYTVMEGRLTKSNSITYADTSIYEWRIWLSGRFTVHSLLYLAILFVACQTVSMILVSIDTTVYRWNVSKCRIGYELAFLYGWAIAALLVAPIALLLMVGVQENYGIKLELYAGSIVFFSVAIFGAILDFSPMSATGMKAFRRIIGSHHLLMFGLVFVHVMFIVYPAIKVWREEHHKLHGPNTEKDTPEENPDLECAEYTRDHLHTLFGNEESMAEFRRFAVLDFSVVLVIFFKKWREAKELVEMGGYWQMQYKQLYDEFLAPEASSPIEMVSEQVKEQLVKQFANDHYTSDMMDKAANEVFEYMYAETYPRFLMVSAAQKKRKISGQF